MFAQAQELTARQKLAYQKIAKGKLLACDTTRKNICPKLFKAAIVDGKCKCVPESDEVAAGIVPSTGTGIDTGAGLINILPAPISGVISDKKNLFLIAGAGILVFMAIRKFM